MIIIERLSVKCMVSDELSPCPRHCKIDQVSISFVNISFLYRRSQNPMLSWYIEEHCQNQLYPRIQFSIRVLQVLRKCNFKFRAFFTASLAPQCDVAKRYYIEGYRRKSPKSAKSVVSRYESGNAARWLRDFALEYICSRFLGLRPPPPPLVFSTMFWTMSQAGILKNGDPQTIGGTEGQYGEVGFG